MFSLDVSSADNSNEITKFCSDKWQEYSSRRTSEGNINYEELLSDWMKLEAKCNGTGIYEIRLASAYMMLDDNRSAKQVLQMDKIPKVYLPLALTVELNMLLFDELSNPPVSVDKLNDIEEKGSSLLSEYPNHLPLYSVVGHLRVLVGDFLGAIPLLEKSLRYEEGDLTAPYRNLTIAYAKTNQFDLSIEAGDKAYELYPNITLDEDYMYAIAISYASIGKIQVTQNVLDLLINTKPEVEHSPKFEEAILNIREIIKKGGYKKSVSQ